MDLSAELSRLLSPDRVLTREIDRVAWANDASVYRLVPRAVVLPATVAEVRALFRFSREHRIPLTFRAAGTSLSGQAVTDGILAVVSRHWRKLQIEDDGRKVRVEPGVIGGVVNQHLGSHGTKIGPDPASIDACMMGGILANNSSGMCCGTEQNAYRTLESMMFVLPDGTVVNTADPQAEQRLACDRPDLVRGLLDLKRRVEGDTGLVERIHTKYGMKNTMGYSLNAFLDFSSPLRILEHLMIGSEGTLAFIAEAVLNTVPDYPFKYTGLLFFHDVADACSAIAPLRRSGARALELMDRASLRSIEDQPGVPARIRDLPSRVCALLVEYQCGGGEQLSESRRRCDDLLPTLPLASAAEFTDDPERQAALWRVRKGLIPSVGAMRARGTSFIIEDVVFPVESLARGVTELQQLFAQHGYDDAIVFGHAKDGNLHFVLIQAFDDARDVARYERFMQELAELVATRHGGALKAEHGTGRNMAPFVRTEWGDEAYEIMRDLKRLVDPDGLLNPGVILNDDARAHVTHLKALPDVEREVDPCIECGFCERMCPSRDLTLTPRQRIVVRREMSRLRTIDPESARLARLEADYGYAAVDTCAVDGMCGLACPVAIDTGSLVKRLRLERHSDVAQELAGLLAHRFELTERAARLILGAGHLARRIVGDDRLAGLSLPGWAPDMPRPATQNLPATTRSGAAAVYLPSCVSRILSPCGADDLPLPRVVVEVAARVGLRVWIPDDVHGHCCGMAFSSKGYDRAYRIAVNRTVESLWHWTRGGEIEVFTDTSPCSLTLRESGQALTPLNRRRWKRLRLLDSVEFAHRRVLPRLDAPGARQRVALHPVCSVHKMGLVEQMREVAETVAGSAAIPVSAGCCGFAGDRGFRVPELTSSALREEAVEVEGDEFVGHYSSSRTCEIGLTRATGYSYRSFWYLLEEALR